MRTPRLETLRVLGLSHRTAAVGVREWFSFDDEAAVRLMQTLRERTGLPEVVLLSTCNRTEVYFSSGDDVQAPEIRTEAVLREVAAARGRPVEDLRPYIYERVGLDAARHLFRVAASLDSLVVGEPQILGQVKNAYRLAREASAIGPMLGRVFERSFKVAKQVRDSTAVGHGEVSVGSVAVDLARKVFGGLETCTVLLIGAGKMGEAVARTLAAGGVRSVIVANRTLERAIEIANRYGWTGEPLQDLAALLRRSDVVIASVASTGYLVSRDLCRQTIIARRYRPLFLVDIAVPRVIDPEAGGLEGVFLYNIDHFNEIIADHRKKRSASVETAERLIEREVASLERAFRQQAIQPVISRLMRWAGELRDQEVQRALREIGPLDERQVQVIRDLADSLARKMLHHPILALRREADDGQNDLSEAVQSLFHLESESAGAEATGPTDSAGDPAQSERT